MRKLDRPGLHAPLACALALACAPGIAAAMEEGFYLGLSAAVEELDVDATKTTDNTHPDSDTIFAGRVSHVRDSDSATASGFGVLAGYTFALGQGGLYLSAELDLAYHSGKARGMMPWVRGAEGRAEEGIDPNWPLSGEDWPYHWTYEKDHSYGLTLRLGGQPEFLTSMLGSGAGLYALLGIRRTEADYSVAFHGCPAIDPPYCAPEGMAHEDYEMGTDGADADYTAWTAGVGVQASIGERLAMQVEAYYADHDRENLQFRYGTVRVAHALEAEEIGLRLRLLRYF